LNYENISFYIILFTILIYLIFSEKITFLSSMLSSIVCGWEFVYTLHTCFGYVSRVRFPG